MGKAEEAVGGGVGETGEGRGGKAGGWPRGGGEESEKGMCLLDIGAQCWEGLRTSN